MKYIINYREQYTEDFIYMFPDMEVLCVIAEHENGDGEYASWDFLKNVDWSDTRLLICDSISNRKKYEKLLEEYKCEQYTEWADDYLLQLNRDYILEISGGKPLIFWGVGNTYKDFIKKYPEIENIRLVDQKPAGSGILSPDDVKNWNRYFVIITSIYYDEIAGSLEDKGVAKTDYISCFDIWESPRDAFLCMQTARKYRNVVCYDPFKIRNIDENGRLVYCICPTWIKESGNLLRRSFEEIENGIYSRLIKMSVLNQTYYFCCKDAGQCALFDRNLYSDYDKTESGNERLTEPGFSQKAILLRTDSSCNLKCESCRDRYITEPVNREKADIIREIVQEQVLPKCDEAIIASAGEFFFSSHYREIVSSKVFNNHIKKLFVMTNGILFNESNWEWLRSVYKNEVQVSVSIDAASAEIYQKMRGGDYQKLLRSLQFISRLRQCEEVRFFGINFVIQRTNYKDMPHFAELGKELKADSIYFGRLSNWGTYTDDEFEHLTMFDMADPRNPKTELEGTIAVCKTISDRINWNNLWTNFRIRDI